MSGSKSKAGPLVYNSSLCNMIKSKAGPLVYNSSLCNMIKSKAGPLVYNSSLCNMISPVLLCAVYGILPISVAQTAINISFFLYLFTVLVVNTHYSPYYTSVSCNNTLPV